MLNLFRLRHPLAILVAACLLVTILGSVGASGQDGDGSEITLQEIQASDELIAAQESLLNVYRCRFSVDTQQVPGGCHEQRPVQGPTVHIVFDGRPTPTEVLVRDDLIAAQESLLNDYRCLFRIDMNIVPGGCHRLAVVSSGAIWTMRGDGTGLVELVEMPVSDDRYSHSSIYDISWSPDGGRIAYSLSYFLSDGSHVRAQIWIVSADGIDHALVFDTGDHFVAYLDQITWSSDGTQLYYVSHCCEWHLENIPTKLWKIGIDGTNRRPLTDASFYSWSPDNSQIVYRKLVDRTFSDGEPYMTSQTWIMNADGGGQRKIRDSGGSFGPVWSPDGSNIAVETITVELDGDRSKDLSVFNTAGSYRRLLDHIPYAFAHPFDSRKTGFSWSPDGKQIAYLDYKGDEDVLTLVGVDGSEKQPLASLGRATTYPVWSLDGTRIAFAPGSAEPYEDGNAITGGGLWTIGPDGTALHRLTPENWHISVIAWSPTRS